MNDDPLHDRFAAAGGPSRESDAREVPAIDALWATSRRRRRNRRLAAVAGSAAALLLVAGVAVAMAPDRGGDGSERVTSHSGDGEAACRAIHRVILPDVDPGDLDELNATGGAIDAVDVPMLARTLAAALADFDPVLVVHLDPDVDDAEVQARVESLRGQPGVEDVRVTSREDTLATFEEMFADQPEMLDTVTADQLPLQLDVEVDAANRDRLVGLLDADLQVMAVSDRTTVPRYVLGAAAYLERKGIDTGLPELRADLGAVDEPWADELGGVIDALLAAPDPSSVVDDTIVTGAAIVRVASGVQEALVGCPEPPEPTVASSTTDSTDTAGPLSGEAAACAAIDQPLVGLAASDGPGLETLLSMYDQMEVGNEPSDEPLRMVASSLAYLTSDPDETTTAVLAKIRGDLERADLPWADDLLALLDEAAASDEPIELDPDRWGAIDEAASEACSVP